MKIAYPIKHWLTSLLISPVFLIIYNAFADTKFVFNEPEIYILFLVIGALLSSPGLLIYFLIYKSIINSNLTYNQIRTILILSAMFMAVIAFWLIKGTMMIPMMLSYITGVLISGLLFPLRSKKLEL